MLSNEQVEEAMSNYPLDRETERAIEVASRRIEKMKDDDPIRKRRRVRDYLLRRGFTGESIAESVGGLGAVDTNIGRE
jgi:SOS response regulatory protein OraA/RecX